MAEPGCLKRQRLLGRKAGEEERPTTVQVSAQKATWEGRPWVYKGQEMWRWEFRDDRGVYRHESPLPLLTPQPLGWLAWALTLPLERDRENCYMMAYSALLQ